MKSNAFKLAVGLIACTAMVGAPTLARPASSLSDLVGARGSSGEQALTSRGFEYRTGNEGQYGTRYSYYWHAGDRNCVQVETYNGRYSSITDATPGDCNEHGGGSGAGAAVAAGVGAAIVAGLLAHRSHHHADNQHNSDQEREAQYERGYNDGVADVQPRNSGSSDYMSGYTAGENERMHHERSASRQGRGSAQVDNIRGPGGMEQRCIERVRRETGVNHVGTNHIEESQAAVEIYVNVRGAQAPWKCLGNRNGTISEVSYTGSEGGL